MTENRPSVIQIVDFVCAAVPYNLKGKDWIIYYVVNVLIGEELVRFHKVASIIPFFIIIRHKSVDLY